MADAAPTITQADIDAVYRAFARPIPTGEQMMQAHARDRALRRGDINLGGKS